MRSLIPSEDLLLKSGLVHLQTGGVGATPRPVFDAIVAAMTELEADPVRGTYGPGTAHLDKVRAKSAALLGSTRDEMLLMASATAGMFLVAQGLNFTHGDRILTTNHEHPGGRLGWEWAERRYGVHVDTISVLPDEQEPQAIIDRFADAILPRTRVLSFSHILFTTGVRLPVQELCALGREHGCWTVVDGAQGAGAMPVDIRAIGCHAYAASGHKWLLGPKGTGLLYLSDDIADALDALPLAAGRHANSDSTGIGNIAGMIGLGTAIDYLQTIGLGRIEAHNLALRGELYDALSRLPQVRIPSPRQGSLASANLAFEFPANVDLHALRANLVMRHKILLRVVDQAGFRGLRASLHLYNDSADIDALVEALEQELS
jgi:selenocysteine lyase/cysteine desulfurase